MTAEPAWCYASPLHGTFQSAGATLGVGAGYGGSAASKLRHSIDFLRYNSMRRYELRCGSAGSPFFFSSLAVQGRCKYLSAQRLPTHQPNQRCITCEIPTSPTLFQRHCALSPRRISTYFHTTSYFFHSPKLAQLLPLPNHIVILTQGFRRCPCWYVAALGT
jgi:hypothetical protein